jgi:hypothetical protein
MMFEITSAASAVFTGARTFEDTVDEISKHASTTVEEQRIARMNVGRLMRVTLEFMNELGAKRRPESPLPEMSVPWFKYGTKDDQQGTRPNSE